MVPDNPIFLNKGRSFEAEMSVPGDSHKSIGKCEENDGIKPFHKPVYLRNNLMAKASRIIPNTFFIIAMPLGPNSFSMR